MGCGCGKSKLPKTYIWAALVDKTYKNVSNETLSSRNPRFTLEPGETVILEQETISHAVRSWIRIGALEVVPD